MQKYIITLLVDGLETPFTVRATTPRQAEKKLYSMIQFAKPIRIETKEAFKERNKPFEHLMRGGFVRTKTTKTLLKDK